jgi:assimilatory nitrate reductase catalytic subunit
LPARTWLSGLFLQEQLQERDRVGLLLGELPGPVADSGPMVCSCFGVGRHTICAAIREHGFDHPAQITACLQAGGNCGSCVPELRQLITEVRATASA